ncbi:MAG TPA: NUDIX hydrolase [Acidimicrobiales bacterium]|nr:NUDIX hydrolase [Acidimicrobiales bacterium]
MRWIVHGERSLYESDWVQLRLVDVELPGGGRFEHHVVRTPKNAAGAVVHHPDRGVLLLWRHRFITDSWGWEIPAGRIEEGESPADAAAREAVEETGWRPGPLRPLCSFNPSNGLSDQRFHIFVAEGAVEEGPPEHHHEAERVAWIPYGEVSRAIGEGKVADGLSLTALSYAFAFGPFPPPISEDRP